MELLEKGKGYYFTYDLGQFVNNEWNYLGEFEGIRPGGKITRILTNVRESGTLPASNAKIPNCLVRIWANDRVDGHRFPIATMRISRPSMDIQHGVGETGDVTLSSVLTFALQDGPDGAYIIEEGSDPVAAAEQIFLDLGLPVQVTRESRSALTSTKVYYGEEWNWLTIANDLLGAANYASADIDRYGTILLNYYRELSEQTYTTIFTDVGDKRNKFKTPLTDEDDWTEVPNVYEVWYETNDAIYSGIAYDNDPDSRISIYSRGYRVKSSETVSELDITLIDKSNLEKSIETLSAIDPEPTEYQLEDYQEAADVLNTECGTEITIISDGVVLQNNVDQLLGYAYVKIDEIDSENDSTIQTELDSLARQKLRASQSNVAATTFTGQYVEGLNINDAVQLDWMAEDRHYTRSLYSMEISLIPSLLVGYRIREFMRGTITNEQPDDGSVDSQYVE